MGLGDEERAAGREEVGHDRRPAADVGQPAQHAPRRVDDVEVAVEVGRAGRRGSSRRTGRRGSRGPSASRRGQLDRGRREVGARDPRPEARPREGVDPEVALQVEQRLAGDVADHLDLVRPRAGRRPRGSPRGRRTRPRRGRPSTPPRARGSRRTIGRRRRDRLVRSSERPHEEHVRRRGRRRRQNDTIWPARSRIQGFSSRGSAPSPPRRRSIQRPAIASSAESGIARDGRDPGRVDPLDGPVARPLAPGPSSSIRASMKSHRGVAAGRDPGGLGEQVEPGRVEPAAEREVGVEAQARRVEVAGRRAPIASRISRASPAIRSMRAPMPRPRRSRGSRRRAGAPGSSVGEPATRKPAASSAATLDAAVPAPPEMIAPAWPMRLPSGAVRPAMNGDLRDVAEVLGRPRPRPSPRPPRRSRR